MPKLRPGRVVFAVLMVLLVTRVTAQAAPVTVAWDRNSEKDVVNYRLSFGSASGVYTTTVDVGNNTSFNVDGLLRGVTYYFVVRAVNSAGVVSDPSSELSYTVPAFPPQEPISYSPTTGAWSATMNDIAKPGTAPAVAPGWLVRSADFDNDGFADFLMYNPNTGLWYKATYNRQGQYSYAGGYNWSPGWTPYVADFNGDGASDVFLYNTTSGRWYLALANGPGDFVYARTGTWSPGWNITISDMNGDGRADIFLYNAAAPPDPNSGRWFRVFTAADLSFDFREGAPRWSGGWQIYPGDFDHNGWGDVFLYNPTSGRWFQVLFSGDLVSYREGLWSGGWTIYPGDFDGDGRTDLFIYNPTSGRWFQVMTTAAGAFNFIEGLWTPNWTVSVTDLDHDGRSDLYLYSTASGRSFQVLTQAPGVFNYLEGTVPANVTVVFSGSR